MVGHPNFSPSVLTALFGFRLKLRPQVKEVYLLYDNENAVTLLVVLRHNGWKLVVKGLSAARAVAASEQVGRSSVQVQHSGHEQLTICNGLH